MKKLLTLILSALIVLSLAACTVEPSGNNTSENQTNSTETGNTEESTQSGNTEESTQSGSTGENKDQESNNEITFSGLVAVDNSECVIKITKIDSNGLLGYKLKLQLENKSDDKTYMFSLENAAINGVQCDPFFATEVAAGKKATDEITFYKNDLSESGIEDYTDIELTFRVYDSNDWTADNIAQETVHIYPYGEDKAVQYVRTPQAEDNIIVDNEYITVIVTGYADNPIWGYSVNVFLLNKTNKQIMFTVDDASVNDYMADPFFAKSVSGGKCAFDSISWSDSTLDEIEVTTIEKIEFKLRAYNYDNWLDDDFVNQAVTLTPKK